MLVLGLFFAGGSTALFGLLSYISPSLDGISWTYLVLAFLLRGCQAIGLAGHITASMTLVSITFTENTTSIMVGVVWLISPDQLSLSPQLFYNHLRNLFVNTLITAEMVTHLGLSSRLDVILVRVQCTDRLLLFIYSSSLMMLHIYCTPFFPDLFTSLINNLV